MRNQANVLNGAFLLMFTISIGASLQEDVTQLLTTNGKPESYTPDDRAPGMPGPPGIPGSECVNTRDNGDKNTCAEQLGTGSSCEKYLGWKDCDAACNLCACSTATGVSRQHCSGHGTCDATCTRSTCSDAKCKCDKGWAGIKCERKEGILEGNFL